jgi:translation initiation factor IF-1
MLFRETVAVYCENHAEHINTLCGQNAETLYIKNPVRTSQVTHYVSATETNRLMLFRETVAVYCEDHTEHTNTLCVKCKDSALMLKQVSQKRRRTSTRVHGDISNKTVYYFPFAYTVSP